MAGRPSHLNKKMPRQRSGANQEIASYTTARIRVIEIEHANTAARRFRHPLAGTLGFAVQHITARHIAHVIPTPDVPGHAF
jgi:hypothetical protein